MDLTLKTKIVSYSDTTENNFAIDLWKITKNKFKIKVIDSKYSNVDYELTSKTSGKKLYLELKCRDFKYSNCDSFIIGKTKIDGIASKQLLPCILVWKFNTLIYYKKYTTDLLNYKTSLIQNSSVIHINKNECNDGMETLVELIEELVEN